MDRSVLEFFWDLSCGGIRAGLNLGRTPVEAKQRTRSGRQVVVGTAGAATVAALTTLGTACRGNLGVGPTDFHTSQLAGPTILRYIYARFLVSLEPRRQLSRQVHKGKTRAFVNVRRPLTVICCSGFEPITRLNGKTAQERDR